MEKTEIYSELTEILRDVFDEDDLVAAPGLSASDVDGWDSLTHVRLILTVERAFGVKFSAAESTGMKNVGELVALISSKTSAGTRK